MQGMSFTTAAYYPPYFDEQGRRHHHDGNATTTEYRCSNGHSWSATTTGSCWCGWPNVKAEPPAMATSITVENIVMPTNLPGTGLDSLHGLIKAAKQVSEKVGRYLSVHGPSCDEHVEADDTCMTCTVDVEANEAMNALTSAVRRVEAEAQFFYTTAEDARNYFDLTTADDGSRPVSPEAPAQAILPAGQYRVIDGELCRVLPGFPDRSGHGKA